MPTFADLFSRQSAAYAQYRPRYPAALYDWLAAVSPGHRLAWDVGTGNGQAAVDLAERFDAVLATDASPDQIARAQPHPRVTYRVATAEAAEVPAHGCDLVTVAQAAHWFDMAAFAQRCRLALRPGGVVAVWAYAFHTSGDPALDQVLGRIGLDELGPFWPPQVRLIWNGYADLPFPFEPIAAPPLDLEVTWTLPELLGYLRSWSASQRYVEAHGRHPAQPHADALLAAWGDPDTARVLKAPLALRVGRVA